MGGAPGGQELPAETPKSVLSAEEKPALGGDLRMHDSWREEGQKQQLGKGLRGKGNTLVSPECGYLVM